MTKLPLSFVSSLRPGYIPEEQLSVVPVPKDATVGVPPGVLVGYVGAPPAVTVTGKSSLVRPNPGTFAIVLLPEPGYVTYAYLIGS